jgi:hypothetical protein
LEEIAVDWVNIVRVLEAIVESSTSTDTSAERLLAILRDNFQNRNKNDWIRLELAAIIDGGSIFRNLTYWFEGDGPLVFCAYDKITAALKFTEDPSFPNVTAVIDCITNDNAQKERLRAHARAVLQPGFDYFKTILSGELAHAVKLLKYARYCNPKRLADLRPTQEKLQLELVNFKCISHPLGTINLDLLKAELPDYVALAADISDEVDILSFFKNNKNTVPTWAKFACHLASQQISSAAAERVFSMLKLMFTRLQDSSISDYVQAAVLKRYNNRNLQESELELDLLNDPSLIF